MKIIETERLYLRELVIENTLELCKVLSDPESMKHYNEPFDHIKVKKWINWNIENYKKYNHGLWAVILKNEDKLIGDCGITMQKIEGKIVPEIGFHIIKTFWNKGYASEAAEACKKYAFSILNYPKIYSYTTLQNIPSQKVAQKIGMETYKVIEEDGKKQIVQVIYNPKTKNQTD